MPAIPIAQRQPGKGHPRGLGWCWRMARQRGPDRRRWPAAAHSNGSHRMAGRSACGAQNPQIGTTQSRSESDQRPCISAGTCALSYPNRRSALGESTPDRRLCARVASDLVATVGAPIVQICCLVPAWSWPRVRHTAAAAPVWDRGRQGGPAECPTAGRVGRQCHRCPVCVSATGTYRVTCRWTGSSRGARGLRAGGFRSLEPY